MSVSASRSSETAETGVCGWVGQLREIKYCIVDSQMRVCANILALAELGAQG